MKHWYKLLLLLLMFTHTVSAGLYPLDNEKFCSALPHLTNSVVTKHLYLADEPAQDVLVQDVLAENTLVQNELSNGAGELGIPENEEGSSLTNHSSHYFISIQRRITSIDRCATQGVEPTYHLLVAFNPPPLLELAMQPKRPVAQQLHWTNQLTAHSSRISGWKESNLLYSHIHGKPQPLS